MKKKKDEIEIFSLEAIADLIARKRTGYNIVSIRNSNFPDSYYSVFKKYRRNYKDIHVQVFDDIESPMDELELVTPEQIMMILAWAKDKERIVVHCAAGISRSSAVAYLIACSRMPPSEAIRMIDPDRHCPNDLVLFHGIKILNDISIYTEYMKWIRKAGLPPKNERQREYLR